MPTPVSATTNVTPNAPVSSTGKGGGTLSNARFSTDAQLAKVLSSNGTITIGSKGDGVKAVQQAMMDMGFLQPPKPDGSFGKMSALAVRNFQVNASKMFPDVKVSGALDAATLRALDQLAPAPGVRGQTKNIPVPTYDGHKVKVIVLKDEHRTFMYDDAGNCTRISMNAVGKSTSQTHEGIKKVTGKLGEAESHDIGKRMWGGWVFGPRIIDLSWTDGRRSGEELHGTSNPEQLGQDVSHGCVRHLSADIIAMFDTLKIGDRVAIVSGLNDKHIGKK